MYRCNLSAFKDKRRSRVEKLLRCVKVEMSRQGKREREDREETGGDAVFDRI